MVPLSKTRFTIPGNFLGPLQRAKHFSPNVKVIVGFVTCGVVRRRLLSIEIHSLLSGLNGTKKN